VYSFELVLPELDAPPIAARRALDRAGVRMPLEGWRSLAIEDRRRLTAAGAQDPVDVEAVVAVALQAIPPVTRVAPRADPDAAAPPEALARAVDPPIDATRWSGLRAVDRYALAHVHKLAVARSAFSALGDAVEGVFAHAAQRPTAPPAPHPPAAPAAPAVDDALATLVAARAPIVEVPAPTAPAPSDLSSHLTDAGEVRMVDVAGKPISDRRAVASGAVRMKLETLERLRARTAPKGEVFAAARLAGIMAAKRTHEIVPLCHLVALTHVEVALELADEQRAGVVRVTATVDARDRTGCEMEALVAVTTACLTIYDMLKGIDRDMTITDVVLVEKRGGRSGHYQRGAKVP
jgi:cyclic pyranopterin phosphate synthase